jgi:hypothetical protein
MPTRMVQGGTFCCLNPAYLLGLHQYAARFGGPMSIASSNGDVGGGSNASLLHGRGGAGVHQLKTLSYVIIPVFVERRFWIEESCGMIEEVPACALGRLTAATRWGCGPPPPPPCSRVASQVPPICCIALLQP